MKVEPAGEDLLRVARDTLLEALLPQLPAESHYTARMVANAMAIAARELGQAPQAPDSAALSRLAAEIRAGRHDEPAARAELIRHLREITRERLAVSNPRILAPAKQP
ncbi:MAG: DUF6285 domain-containing protein [Betaproteobacteria bacterium]